MTKNDIVTLVESLRSKLGVSGQLTLDSIVTAVKGYEGEGELKAYDQQIKEAVNMLNEAKVHADVYSEKITEEPGKRGRKKK